MAEIKENIEYQALSRTVGKDNEIQSALKEGYELLKAVKKSQNNELYQKFLKEYKDLEKSIKDSLLEDRKISKRERAQIMFELGDLVDLAEDNGVIEAKNLWSYFGDYLKKTNTKDSRSKAESLREKSMENYSIEEAIGALEYTNHNYKNYKEISDEEKSITFFYDSIEQIDDRYELELFQGKLIEKIRNSGKYPNLYFGYNKEVGYFIVSEQEIINAINSGNIGEISHEILVQFLAVNKDLIKTKVSEQGLSQLATFGLKSENKDITKAVISLGIISKESFTTIDKTKIEKFKEFFSFNFNNLESDFFLEFPEYIYTINDKEKLLKIIEVFAFTNDNPLKFNLFSPKIVDINIIEAYYENTQIQLTSQEIGALPEKCFEFKNTASYEKIAKLFKATDYQAYPLLINRIGIFRFRDFIANYDFEAKQDIINSIPDYYLTGEKNQKYNEAKFKEIIKKESYNDKDLSYIDDFIGYMSIVENISTSQMKHYIIKILHNLPEQAATLLSLPNTINVISNNKALLFKSFEFYPAIFSFLNLKQRSDLNTIKALLKVEKDNTAVLKYIELDNGEPVNSNIVNILEIYRAIKQKYSENKELLSSIFNNPVSKAKLYGFLQTIKNEDIKILKKYNKDFEEISAMIKGLSEKTKKLIDVYNSKKENAEELKQSDVSILEAKIKELIPGKPETAKKILYFIKNGSIDMLKQLAGEINPEQLEQILDIKIKHNTRAIIEESENFKIDSESLSEKSREIIDKTGINIEKLKIKLENLLKQNQEIDISTQKGRDEIIELFIKTYELENISQENKNKLSYILNKQIETHIFIYINNKHSRINNIGQIDFNKDFYKNFDETIKQERQITKEVKRQLENKNIPKETNTFKENQNYSYNPENNTLKISIENGQTEIPLSKQDRLAIKENPENLEKIVNFYKVLDKVGLTKLWNIKEQIFIAIQNKYGIGFNLKDGDYLNQNETKIFLNTILKSVGEKEISPVFNLETFLAKIEVKNKTQLGGEEAEVNVFGETYIEAKFLNKFFPKANYTGFKFEEFQKAIS